MNCRQQILAFLTAGASGAQFAMAFFIHNDNGQAGLIIGGGICVVLFVANAVNE